MQSRRPTQPGFTLVEILVVVTIIGILAALILSAANSSTVPTRLAVARTQLAQMESAIGGYRAKTGAYPPDNPNNPAINPLYFELLGTTNNGDGYVTLDGIGRITNSIGDINAFFGRQGFFNTSPRAHSGDDSGAAVSFLEHLHPSQVGSADATKPLIKILVCSVEWPADKTPAPIPGTTLNPWCYVSSHPTHNTGSYDLWVDLVIRGKTYRVSNWSKQPEIVP